MKGKRTLWVKHQEFKELKDCWVHLDQLEKNLHVMCTSSKSLEQYSRLKLKLIQEYTHLARPKLEDAEKPSAGVVNNNTNVSIR